MYKFEKLSIDKYNFFFSNNLVVESCHKKVFKTEGTSPVNQSTLNLYLTGTFELFFDRFNYKQVLESGQTSLDILLTEYPIGDVLTEKVLSEKASRVCISSQDNKMKREVLSLNNTDLLIEKGIVVYPFFGNFNLENRPQLIEDNYTLTGTGKVLLLHP